MIQQSAKISKETDILYVENREAAADILYFPLVAELQIVNNIAIRIVIVLLGILLLGIIIG